MHFLLARISCGMLVRCCFSCKCNVDASHGCTCAHHESYIISMELLHSVTLRHLHIVSTVSPILISIVALSTCSALPSLTSRVYSQACAFSSAHGDLEAVRCFSASRPSLDDTEVPSCSLHTTMHPRNLHHSLLI